ncbi:hypothetical protein G9A89_005899 [Geosiphon pyriformis]|nr:hypothetical protein G9A89_005899 [Geosiphon pyriformis]
MNHDGDLDAMWDIFKGVVIDSADEIFSRLWFSEFECVKNKLSSKFYRLELLLSKIVKSLNSNLSSKTDYLVGVWMNINGKEVSMVRGLIDSGSQVVFDHLIVDDELILELLAVKSSVDMIIEGWMKKCLVFGALARCWADQYALLDYIDNDTFSGVMGSISMDELLQVVRDLPDGKTAGISGIPNEL